MCAKTIGELNVGANACSVEWCPTNNLESYVACSTYLLENTLGASFTRNDAAGSDTTCVSTCTQSSPDRNGSSRLRDEKLVAKLRRSDKCATQRRSGTVLVKKVRCIGVQNLLQDDDRLV